MKFEIHFYTNKERTESDFVVVEGATVEEIREKADAEVAKRGGIEPWSKMIRS